MPSAGVFRRAIITQKVNICLTFLGTLHPYFLLSKVKASCSLTPPPFKVGKSFTLSGARVLRIRLICKQYLFNVPSMVDAKTRINSGLRKVDKKHTKMGNHKSNPSLLQIDPLKDKNPVSLKENTIKFQRTNEMQNKF